MSVRGDDETVAGTIAGVGPNAANGGASLGEGIDRIANRYQIIRWLGGGGMGRVYEAQDLELDERIALKVLKTGLVDEALERFRREVKLTRRIQHKNVARMFDIGEHAGEKFLTMELVEGEPLTKFVGAGPMPWGKLRAAALQIANGLAAAHECGVIHRDLKPDNVLVETATGRFVITDFGIARVAGNDQSNMTQVGVVVGTPRYMAPEQLAGHELDARADLFAYGIMMFELATGKRPWNGDSPIAIAVAQATQPARPFVASGIPPAFATLVMACLQLDPAARPQTAADIARRITDETEAADVATGRTPKFATPTGSAAAVSTGAMTGAAMTIATAETTIAVLPVTCAPGDEYLADGMHEDLIDTLSTTPSVRVRPAGLVRGVNVEPDIRELGRRLDVEHIVSVSLRRTPSGLRVSARLIGVGDGFQIWAHRADCTDAEILTQTDALARGIAGALSTRAHTATRPTDPRAVDLFLRARAELRLFMGEHVARAVQLLDEAVKLAPTSAPILGAHAFANVQRWVLMTDPTFVEPARKAIDLAMASGHGEAYLAASIFKMNHADTFGGASDLGHALARAPMSAQTHEWVGKILLETGPIDESKKHFDIALGLDPGRARPIAPELLRLAQFQRDWAGAERGLESLEASGAPALIRLATVLRYRLHKWSGVKVTPLRADAVGFAQRFGPHILSIFEMVDGRRPLDLAEADRELVAHFGQPRPRRVQLFSLQIIAEEAVTMLPDERFALHIIEAAAANGLMDVTWMDYCPLFDRLRNDMAWIGLRDRVADHAARVYGAIRAIAPT